MITVFKEYQNPNKVYIPITDTTYKIANVKVDVDEEVVIGQTIAEKFKGKDKLPVISSVSGTVVGFEVLTDRYGKKVDHCVIENNRKDKKIEIKTYENATSSEVRKVIADFGLETIDIDGIYTPMMFNKKVNHLVVNSIFVTEPLYTVDYFYLQDNAEKIAAGIVLLAKACLTESVTLLVDKRMPEEALEQLGKATVDKNINLVTVDPMKMNGQPTKIIKGLVKEDLYPNLLNSGVMYVSTDAAKIINDVIYEGIIPVSRQIVLTGDGIKSSVIYDVRFGTLLKDLVDDLEGYNEVEEMVLHIGNFLTGIQVTSDEIAITQTVDAINISEYHETEEDVCIKCGDCNDVCPVGILPQNIMDAELRGVNSRIMDLQTDLCTECGLCSYVCPSKINVLEWVRRAKRRVG